MNTQAEQMYSVVQLLHLMHYYRKYDLDQDYQISATFYLVVKGLRRLASFRVCDHHYWGLAGAAASTTWRQQDLVRGGGLRSGPRGESGRVSESLQHLQLLLHHRSLPSPQLHPSLTPRGPDRHLLPLPLLPPLLPLLLTTIFLIMQASFQHSTSHDKVRRIVAEEGHTARNPIAWSVPLRSKDDGKPKCQTGRKSKKTIQGPHKTTKQSTVVDCKITSTTGEKHFHDSPTKTRHPCKIYPRDCCYWAFLFDNLRWAVDKIYVICDSDQSVVECKVRIFKFFLHTNHRSPFHPSFHPSHPQLPPLSPHLILSSKRSPRYELLTLYTFFLSHTDERDNASDLDSNATEFDNTNDEPDINVACQSSDLPKENEANTNGYHGESSGPRFIEFDHTQHVSDVDDASDNHHFDIEMGVRTGAGCGHTNDSNVIKFDNTNDIPDFHAAHDSIHFENETVGDIHHCRFDPNGPRFIEFDHTQHVSDVDDASDNHHFDIEMGVRTGAGCGHTNDSNVIKFDNTNDIPDFHAAHDSIHFENETVGDIHHCRFDPNGPRFIEFDHTQHVSDVDDASDNHHFDIEMGVRTGAGCGHTNGR
ncbi:hypothetical protein STEG23_032498 [Scotinomys teguina]